MEPNTEICLFWFRRDLRAFDNHGFYKALANNPTVVPIFIFDPEILKRFDCETDKRLAYIIEKVKQLKKSINLQVFFDQPITVFNQLVQKHTITAVYTNQDYEPQAIARDAQVKTFLATHNIAFHSFKDQVIFHENDILKTDGSPYTVFTPYSKKWKETFNSTIFKSYPSEKLLDKIATFSISNFAIDQLPFSPQQVAINETVDLSIVKKYNETRDYPGIQGTTDIATALRFGTVSIRACVEIAHQHNETWLNELIWREFYLQILFHFPQVVTQCFKPKYENINWRNNETEFQLWCEGKTGYAIVDAGMRELNQTGKMHNRVRMVVASFLCKHLLIDWRWGEAYFAQKLLDYDLAANNGNWQWAAGCGCDAAPYFRIFNPYEQTKKFDPKLTYIKKWVPEYDEFYELLPIVDHKFARERTLTTYKKALDNV
ncbi:DNA photolyase family protein [Flavobacterium agricola]|uniref:DNA photolyase family protein n=1 Tax=Flavobacterium agricola TaxID=2870839 RepID=A0ABY6LW85_9FLAO|nr:deoxyribodipyrimidine photo-lyase [Flavobacterium agricola]UYW00449.1 DNA photolyase family protein [Flavobacterium agricola]